MENARSFELTRYDPSVGSDYAHSRRYVPALAALVAYLAATYCVSSQAGSGAADACGASKLVDAISIAKFHTCARLHDGGVKCWGFNGNGQVGDGTRKDRASPTLVAGLCGVTTVSTGGESTCASVEQGSVRCWGLGFGDVPVEIRDTGAVVRVAMSQIEACGLRRDGSVVCWGPTETRRPPRTIAITDVTHLVGSKGKVSRFFARRADGSVWRWLGSERPAQIPMAPARDLSCGIATCCALLDDASITCWDPENPSAPVAGLRDVVQVTAGNARSCAILKDRTVRCWGRGTDIGTFGDGSSGDHAVPSPIPGLTAVRQIDPGNFNSCAVLDDGAVKCWGGATNLRGPVVGDGTAEKRLTPVDVVM